MRYLVTKLRKITSGSEQIITLCFSLSNLLLHRNSFKENVYNSICWNNFNSTDRLWKVGLVTFETKCKVYVLVPKIFLNFNPIPCHSHNLWIIWLPHQQSKIRSTLNQKQNLCNFLTIFHHNPIQSQYSFRQSLF